MTHSFNCIATGIGSLPVTDPEVAASLSIKYLPEAPIWPQLPQRDFREHWMAPQGGMLLGVSQVVMAGKTVGYEYLKIETRPDGVYYVAVPSDSKEEAFRYAGVTIDTAGDRGDHLFAFENPALEFPKRIVYRQATGGWLYAQVEGKVNGADRQVIYPMRHVDCATGAFLQK